MKIVVNALDLMDAQLVLIVVNVSIVTWMAVVVVCVSKIINFIFI